MTGYSSEKIHLGGIKIINPTHGQTRSEYESLQKIDEEEKYTTPFSNQDQS
jgi:hypothetical protein